MFLPFQINQIYFAFSTNFDNKFLPRASPSLATVYELLNMSPLFDITTLYEYNEFKHSSFCILPPRSRGVLLKIKNILGEIFPELHTTPSLEEESTEEEPEVEECEPSPSARPALSAMTTPQPTPKEDSLTNLDSQYYR